MGGGREFARLSRYPLTELRSFVRVGSATQSGQSAMAKVSGMVIPMRSRARARKRERERERERERDRGFKLFRNLPEERRPGAKLRDNSRRALIDLVIVDARARVFVYTLLHNTRECLIRYISAMVTRAARVRVRARPTASRSR